MTSFAEYVKQGWKLTPIPSGLKGPVATGWNLLENAVSHPAAASRLEAAGLCHAYSGTCAIDIDNYAEAKLWLLERGIDLDKLVTDVNAVQIKSPAANRGKLIYRLPVPLPSKKINGPDGKHAILELRCGTTTGNTMQDVLPPSPHPDANGVIDGYYEWIGDWRKLPELPAEIFTLWQTLVSGPDECETERTSAGDHLITLLQRLSPDMGYDEWLRVGMAIHHEHAGSDEGLQLWDAWSQNSAKYKGVNDLLPHWNSFTPGGGITAQSLVQMQDATIDDFASAERMQAVNEAVQKDLMQGVHLWTARELLKPHDAPPYLVDRLLERDSEASLIGPSGSYKSLWALQLGISVATGTPFFGRETEQGLVVYLCGEGFGGIRHRLQALKHGLDMDFSDAPFVVLPRSMPLPTQEGVDTVRAYIAAAEAEYNQKLKLLIVDTYGRYAAGEENVAEDLYAFFRSASACRDGAALLVVHHTGHSDSSRGRGTSAWQQAVDTEFVASIKDDTDTRVFENTKQKDGQPNAPMYFRLAQKPTDSTRAGEPITSVVLEATVAEQPKPKLSTNETLVYETIQQMSGWTEESVVAAIVDKIPKPEGTDRRGGIVRKALVGLENKHAVVIKGGRIFLSSDLSHEFADLIGVPDEPT